MSDPHPGAGKAGKSTEANAPLEKRGTETAAAPAAGEPRHRILFSAMSEGFAWHEIICDAEGKPCDYRFLEINPAFEQLTGLKAADLLGRSVREVIPAVEPVWIERYGRVVLTGEPARFEEFAHALNRWYEVYAFRTEPGRFAVIFSDITERKRVEEAVRESEERFRAVFESSSDCILVWDRQYSCLYANQAAIDHVGTTRENVIGRNIRDGLGHVPDFMRLWMERVDRAFATGEAFRVEDAIPVGGRLVHGESQISPIRDAAGQVFAVSVVYRDVTARKQAEDALRESERFIQSVAASLPQWVYVFDFDTMTLSYANRSILADLGYLDEAQATHLLEVFQQFMAPGEEAHLARLLDEWRRLPDGRIREDEYCMRHADGTMRFLHGRELVFSRHPDGTVHRILGSVLDITDRKGMEDALRKSRTAALNLMDDAVAAREEAERASAELRQSREDLDRAQEVGQIGSWRMDVQRNVLTWSDENHRIFGVPKGTPMTYETFLGTIHPDDRQYVDTRWSAALRGEPYDIEHRIVVDGQVKWVREKAYLELDKSGNLLGGFGITQDITERKAAEKALQEAHERAVWLARFPEENPNPVMRVSAEGNAIYCNPAANELAGWGCAVGQSVSPPVLQLVKRAMAEEKEVEGELELGGEHFAISVMPFPAERYANVYGRDISERRRMELALRETADDLARSNKDLEQFAYVASHDLQEPLRMVTSFMQLLERKYQGKLDPSGENYIRFAVDGAKRMQGLIGDLLSYSRVGSRAGEPAPVSAEQVLHRALTNLQFSIKENNVRITQGSLPVVRADAVQLAQVFQNLLANAIKFHGEAPPQIHIDVRRDRDYWEFSVRDNGIGIDPQFGERIFQIFQRLHTRVEYPGTGIGLAICKKIVERHGGKIWVESKVGEGSTFFFTLPA
jgi:PAS domain S-box-containing protein